jgi:membrane protein
MGSVLSRSFVLFKDALVTLKRKEPLILASSTSFFTAFAIIPLLVLLTNILRLYFRKRLVTTHFGEQLQEIFGKETGNYLKSVTTNLSDIPNDWLITLGGFAFLFFVATNLLTIIKISIHRVWNIKRKHVSRIRYTFKERSVAIGIILITAVLVSISILLDTTVALMSDYLKQSLPSVSLLLIRVINSVFSLLVITGWFTVLFKVLPDARIHWRVAGVGALITALLFNAGKFILGKLLIYSAIANIFGASASFALILLFIFYSSLILYYGAAFTFVFGSAVGLPVLPGKYSERYEVVSIDGDNGG